MSMTSSGRHRRGRWRRSPPRPACVWAPDRSMVERRATFGTRSRSSRSRCTTRSRAAGCRIPGRSRSGGPMNELPTSSSFSTGFSGKWPSLTRSGDCRSDHRGEGISEAADRIVGPPGLKVISGPDVDCVLVHVHPDRPDDVVPSTGDPAGGRIPRSRAPLQSAGRPAGRWRRGSSLGRPDGSGSQVDDRRQLLVVLVDNVAEGNTLATVARDERDVEPPMAPEWSQVVPDVQSGLCGPERWLRMPRGTRPDTVTGPSSAMRWLSLGKSISASARPRLIGNSAAAVSLGS